LKANLIICILTQISLETPGNQIFRQVIFCMTDEAKKGEVERK